MCALVNQEFVCVDSGIIYIIKEVIEEEKEVPQVKYQSIWDENNIQSESLSSFINKKDLGEFATLPY